MRICVAVLCVALIACGESAPTVTREATVPPLLLARHGEALEELTLPASSRPDAQPAPETLDVLGPFKLVRTIAGVQTWQAPLPFRSRKLFYSHAPPGAVVKRGPKKLRFSNGPSGAKNADSWDFTQSALLLRREAKLGEPSDGDYQLSYPAATSREDALNRATSDAPDDESFALRSMQLGDSTRTGVYLPAPSVAAWDVKIPTDGVLTFDATILPPETRVQQRSDGATVLVELDLAGAITVVSEIPLRRNDLEEVRVDLSAWAGQHARLRLRTEPGESTDLDYVFLAEPTLYTPVQDPRRLLLVFTDTLRPDHLGTYGYARETSPRLDAWAAEGAVFEQARSVAPWTLPSTRTVLTGLHPERWRTAPPLQERLAAAGWATGAFVGNVYLSANFDMADGWTRHYCVNWPPAEDVIAQLEQFMARYPDRDAMAMLHLMDMHLPYNEPRAYRGLWAGDAPRDFDASSATRSKILKAHKTDGEALEQYLVDRYDQNLRYLDDQLGELFADLGEDTPIVLFADHGEEFWDHGDFEHGHSLYDEVLRVPLIVRAPGVKPGRVDAPVSLLDVAPTVLDLLDLPTHGMAGRSLLPVANGDKAAAVSLESRPQPVGRPLYGLELWGVIQDGQKWTTRAGDEHLFDLTKDAQEQEDLGPRTDTTSWHPRLGEGLGTWSGPVLRILAGSASRSPKGPIVVELSSATGFQSAWLGVDPMSRAKASAIVTPEGVAQVTFEPGARGTREIYARPVGEVTALEGLTLRILDGTTGEVLKTQVRTSTETPTPDGQNHLLLKTSAAHRSLKVTYGIAAEPPADGEAIEAFSSEVEEALKLLGYVE